MNGTAAKRKSQPTRQPRLVRKRVASLKSPLENSELYDGFNLENEDDKQLCDDIEAKGQQNPGHSTKDGYMFDGNRRLAVARALGRVWTNVFVHDFRWVDLSHEEKLKLLRRPNLQRKKSFAEELNETIIDVAVDHEEAVLNLKKRRHYSENGYLSDPITKPVKIERRGLRHYISHEKSEHVYYLKKVMNDLREFWGKISVRVCHYKLLNYDFSRNKRLGLKYVNDNKSYKATVDLKNRLCFRGELPFHAFADETRPFERFLAWQNVQQFIKQDYENFLSGYQRSYLQSQPHYVAALVEKNTVYSFALKVTEDYRLPTLSGRGFAAVQALYELHQSYLRSGKKKMVLIVLSDYDPEGERLLQSAAQVLTEDFGVSARNLDVIKAGITREQVDRYGLQEMLFAKEKSKNRNWFLKRTGGDARVWELEALDPSDLLSELRNTITGVLDMELFREEVAKEEEEADELLRARKTALEALKYKAE